MLKRKKKSSELTHRRVLASVPSAAEDATSESGSDDGDDQLRDRDHQHDDSERQLQYHHLTTVHAAQCKYKVPSVTPHPSAVDVVGVVVGRLDRHSNSPRDERAHANRTQDTQHHRRHDLLQEVQEYKWRK